ncbi:MAG: hypothetical protein ACRDMJ_09855 [Solirubrobacteraceae bacterium]
MNSSSISRDDWILGGIALLLVIDLLFLPWFSFSAGPFSFTWTATDAPDGWLGVLGVLAALALIVDLGVERLAPQTRVPSIGGSRTQTRFALAAATALFVALKFLFHVHFSLFGFGFWLGIVLAAALVVLALRARSGVPLIGTMPRTGS